MPQLLRRVAILALAVAVVLVSVSAAPAVAAKKKTRDSVSWKSDTWQSGAGGYLVKGKLSGPVKRRVVLQHQTATGWRTLDRTRTTRKQKFKMKGGWDWYGQHRMRVVAPPARKARGVSFKPHKFKVQSGYDPRGGRNDFVYLKSRGLRWRWNPCQKIRYRVNYADVGPGVLPTVKAAMELVERGSGLNFQYVGKTDIVPLSRRKFGRKADFVIAWATEQEEPLLKGTGGRGAPTWGYQSRDRRGKLWKIQYGGITLNADVADLFFNGWSSSTQLPLAMLLIHEVGHGLGLDHTKRKPDADQAMHWTTWAKHPSGQWTTQWGAGDLTGLRNLGAQGGCIKSPRFGRVAGRGPVVPVDEVDGITAQPRPSRMWRVGTSGA